MKVKVQCPCEARFEFEVEPVNGRMPVQLNCPVCSMDATELANEVIRRQLAAAPAASPTPPEAPKLRINSGAPAPVYSAPPAEAPAPTAAAPSGGGGLRIARSSSHAPQQTAAAPTAAPAGNVSASDLCPRHLNEQSVEICRVCGKPICLKCMQQFGYVCSVYCRGQANQKKIPVPVYAHQRDVAEGRSNRKARNVVIGVLGLVALFIAAWIWYEFMGSYPKVVYTVQIPKNSGTQYELIGPGQYLAISDSQISLFDVPQNKQLWATPLAAASERPKQQKRLKTADTTGEDEDDDYYGSYSGYKIITTSNDIWVVSYDKVYGFDRKSGAAKDVQIKGNVQQITRNDSAILVFTQKDAKHRGFTQISLADGSVKTDEIDLTPKTAANTKTNAKKSATSSPIKTTQIAETITGRSEDEDFDSDSDFSFARNGDQFVGAGANVAQFKVKLVEQRTEVHEGMKKKGNSLIDSDKLTASRSLEAAEELLNDMRREDTGGGKVTEDVSRYQVTLTRWLAQGIPDWTGEVIGPPRFHALKTVDIVTAGRSILVFDKNNKKLWESKLTYPAGGRYDFDDGESPCLEHDDTLYFADQGMLTSFNLKTGEVRWRLTSVGISKIQLDDDGQVFLNTTTATPDSIQYSQQISLRNQVESVVQKVDAETGKSLWKAEKMGECILSGKFIYATKVSSSMAALRLEDGPDMHYNLFRIKSSNGREKWRYHESKNYRLTVHGNWMLLQFGKEVKVLKFLSL